VSQDLYDAIFAVAAALEVPVIILALLALAVVVVELGAYLVEAFARRRRTFPGLAATAAEARRQLEDDDRDGAAATLSRVAWSASMATAFDAFAAHAARPGADTRLAKELAEFDFGRQRRLARTRLLVRVGPALGLMGTLIPLSPALEGLANGNIRVLTDNLRVAFSVTVLGLLIGAVAFALSLGRDRMYGQDYSDLEYVAAVLTDPAPPAEPAPDADTPRTSAGEAPAPNGRSSRVGELGTADAPHEVRRYTT
jgi:biopolymer transport protein ExbB/TolQ